MGGAIIAIALGALALAVGTTSCASSTQEVLPTNPGVDGHPCDDLAKGCATNDEHTYVCRADTLGDTCDTLIHNKYDLLECEKIKETDQAKCRIRLEEKEVMIDALEYENSRWYKKWYLTGSIGGAIGIIIGLLAGG